MSFEAAGQDPGTILSMAPLATPLGATPPPAPQPPTLHTGPDGGHFVLVVATRAVLLCVLSSEGAMAVLHIFFPPRGMHPDALGHAAWRLDATRSDPGRAVAAVAWGTSVSLYRIVLHHATAEDSDNGPLPPLPAPQLLASFSSGFEVCGMGFLGAAGALAITTASGEASTTIYVRQPLEPRSSNVPGAVQEEDPPPEVLHVADWLVGRQLGTPGDPSFHASIAAGGEQLLLLTSRGVGVVQLMSWHQRLSTLVSMGRLELALLSALRLCHALDAGPPQQAQHGTWPADSADPAQRDAVVRQLLTVLCAYIDNDLSSLRDGDGGDLGAEAAAERLADVAIDACLLPGCTDALFSDVAPRFLQSPYAAAFLRQLEPRILGDALTSLAPDVMHALTEHFVACGQPERVERCVLKMDILSLDLNQLIPLCLRYGLYGALIHIFSRAMRDYQTPAVLLLAASALAMASEGAHNGVAHDGTGGKSPAAMLSSSAALRLGMKLLVYLQCCLQGEHYPPGSAEGTAPAQEWQSMRLNAVAFLLYSTRAQAHETWALWASVAHMVPPDGEGQGDAAIPPFLKDPSPALRYLCDLDAPTTLRMLRDGLRGWDALEADVADAIPELRAQLSDRAPAGGVRTLAQAAVDAVVGLLEDSAPDGQARNRSKQPGAAEAAQLQFLAEHLAANRVEVHGEVLLRVLRFLATDDATGSLSADEREATFKDVIAHVDQVPDSALTLAHVAGFAQAEARIHHRARQYAEALRCMAGDHRHPSAPFRYLREILEDPRLTPAEHAAFQQAVLGLMPRLVRLDAAETATCAAECFADRQLAVLEALAPCADDQFAFLQAAVELQRSLDVGTTGMDMPLVRLLFKSIWKRLFPFPVRLSPSAFSAAMCGNV